MEVDGEDLEIGRNFYGLWATCELKRGWDFKVVKI